MSAWGAREPGAQVVDAGREEEGVEDQLPAPLEEVEQVRRPVRPLEAVLLLHGHHPRHPPAFGGQRVAGAGQLLLLDQQLLAGGIPLPRRDDRRHLHFGSSLRYSSTTSNRRPQMARWRSIQSAASSSTSGRSESRCVRPSTTLVTTPVSSRTFRCLEIAGLETSKAWATSPAAPGPAATASHTPRRIGCESALNESLTTWGNIANARTKGPQSGHG